MRLSTTANRFDGEAPRLFRGPLAVVGWDGVLPLVAAGAPLLISLVFPQDDAAAMLAVVMVPIVTALVRTMVGWDQIARICNGGAPWLRQVALAIAIVILLLFELCSAMLIFAGGVPPEALLIPLVLYCFYLVMISLALWRPRDESVTSRGTKNAH